jgi:crotonobetainyl-CoA:carnitine CoA-transferase CaiB-like acyl-CoA transferase
MRRPDLAANPALATAAGRRRHEDEIEAAVRQWLADVRPDIAMVSLQGAGIPAGIAKLPQDLAADPHLLSVGHWQPSDRPFMGPHLLPSVAYREGDATRPYAINQLAPTLGQHNREVLNGILGLTEEEIAELERDDIIGTTATMPKKRAETSSVKTARAAE